MTADLTAGAAYRRQMIALGGDDYLARQRETAAQFRTLIEQAGSALRDATPGEWSVLQLIGHMVDAELVVGYRYRAVISEDRPTIAPYDQDAWVAGLDHDAADPEALVAEFEALRRANIDLWERSTPEQRRRIGIHAERGEESLEDMFRMQAGHGVFHVEQAQRTLQSAWAERKLNG